VRHHEIVDRDRGAAGGAPHWNRQCGFTLLEVMIAVAFIGIAMLALLSLHHSNLESVIRAQDLTRASMLAQQIMSTAEVDRFPPPGQTHGDFSRDFQDQYNNFRWQREVDVLPQFPDIRRVRVTIFFGRNFGRKFDLVEFMHNPTPPQLPGMAGQGGPGNPDAADSQGDTDQ
jgi:general secretion pathway protein I